MTDNSKISFCRVAWKINAAEGHGAWHDISQEAELVPHIVSLNRKYGQGIHHMEYDDGTESYRVAQDMINKAKVKFSMVLSK